MVRSEEQLATSLTFSLVEQAETAVTALPAQIAQKYPHTEVKQRLTDVDQTVQDGQNSLLEAATAHRRIATCAGEAVLAMVLFRNAASGNDEYSAQVALCNALAATMAAKSSATTTAAKLDQATPKITESVANAGVAKLALDNPGTTRSETVRKTVRRISSRLDSTIGPMVALRRLDPSNQTVTDVDAKLQNARTITYDIIATVENLNKQGDRASAGLEELVNELGVAKNILSHRLTSQVFTEHSANLALAISAIDQLRNQALNKVTADSLASDVSALLANLTSGLEHSGEDMGRVAERVAIGRTALTGAFNMLGLAANSTANTLLPQIATLRSDLAASREKLNTLDAAYAE